MLQKTKSQSQILPFLDHAAALFATKNRQNIFNGMSDLYSTLFDLKHSLSEEQWFDFTSEVKTHPITKLLAEAPQFAHSQTWPRGYMGDAEMMDLIYGFGNSGYKEAHTSLLGYHINENQQLWASHQAARRRLMRIARMIDKVVLEKGSSPGPDILSIACGHLREIHYCHSIRAGSIGQFVALDQDENSLLEIDKTAGHLNIELLNQPIGSILKGKINKRFDLIYAAGLYDYLKERTAKVLTETIFSMLKPGGRLFIANFTPETKEMGFLEAFMDWKLIYRDLDDMIGLTDGLPQHKTHIAVYPDTLTPDNRLIYLEATRLRD